jgi:hypothetical protein
MRLFYTAVGIGYLCFIIVFSNLILYSIIRLGSKYRKTPRAVYMSERYLFPSSMIGDYAFILFSTLLLYTYVYVNGVQK